MRSERQTRGGATRFETREENGKKKIEGYFAVFDSNYEIFDGATESIDRHAFDGALDGDIRALIDHETRLVLGRTTAGTMTLRVDEHGLWGSIEINEQDSDAMNLYARVQRGDVSQCSFGFDILQERTDVDPGLSPCGESGLKSCYGCDRCPRSGVWESRLKYQQVFFLQ